LCYNRANRVSCKKIRQQEEEYILTLFEKAEDLNQQNTALRQDLFHIKEDLLNVVSKIRDAE